MTLCMTYAYQLMSVYHCMCRDKALISADGILLVLVLTIVNMLHAFPKGSVILLA